MMFMLRSARRKPYGRGANNGGCGQANGRKRHDKVETFK